MENVVIIGGGPAGLSAAVYTARADLKPIVIEGIAPGGQLMLTTHVDNYPGFEEGVLGPDLMVKMRKQAERFGTRFITDNVVRVEAQDKQFAIHVAGQPTPIQTKTVIVATGASSKMLGLPNEKRLMAKGVSTCATCDGFFFRDQNIAVVGGGDSALEEATFLTKFAKKVYLIHRRDTFRASKIMQHKAESNPKIEFVLNSAVEDILGDTGVTGIKVINLETKKETTIELTGVFIAIGHIPNTALFKDLVQLDEKGYIQISKGTMTSHPGIFAAGDVADSIYRQAITSAGTGCMAALDVEKYLSH